MNGRRSMLVSCGIPFINSSTGVISNNGALVLNTALAVTYSGGAYIYCQAGSIYTTLNSVTVSNPAGWYYCVFSSTTACTIYNNMYISGPAVIPGSPIAFTTATAPTGNVFVATNISGFLLATLNITVPANSIGPNGSIRIERFFTVANTGNTKQYGISLGGQIFEQSSGNNVSQVRDLPVIWNSGNIFVNGGLGVDSVGSQTFTMARGLVTSTVDQLLTSMIQIQNASDWIVQEYFGAETLYGA